MPFGSGCCTLHQCCDWWHFAHGYPSSPMAANGFENGIDCRWYPCFSHSYDSMMDCFAAQSPTRATVQAPVLINTFEISLLLKKIPDFSVLALQPGLKLDVRRLLVKSPTSATPQAIRLCGLCKTGDFGRKELLLSVHLYARSHWVESSQRGGGDSRHRPWIMDLFIGSNGAQTTQQRLDIFGEIAEVIAQSLPAVAQYSQVGQPVALHQAIFLLF